MNNDHNLIATVFQPVTACRRQSVRGAV